MIIPRSVKIGALTYKVNITENLVLGCDYGGEILYDSLNINIRPMAPERMEQSFLHEVCHGIFDHLGYVEHDEKKIDELAGSLHELIVANPEMFENGMVIEPVEPDKPKKKKHRRKGK